VLSLLLMDRVLQLLSQCFREVLLKILQNRL
jgi:hypothetical protein